MLGSVIVGCAGGLDGWLWSEEGQLRGTALSLEDEYCISKRIDP